MPATVPSPATGVVGPWCPGSTARVQYPSGPTFTSPDGSTSLRFQTTEVSSRLVYEELWASYRIDAVQSQGLHAAVADYDWYCSGHGGCVPVIAPAAYARNDAALVALTLSQRDDAYQQRVLLRWLARDGSLTLASQDLVEWTRGDLQATPDLVFREWNGGVLIRAGLQWRGVARPGAALLEPVPAFLAGREFSDIFDRAQGLVVADTDAKTHRCVRELAVVAADGTVCGTIEVPARAACEPIAFGLDGDGTLRAQQFVPDGGATAWGASTGRCEETTWPQFLP